MSTRTMPTQGKGGKPARARHPFELVVVLFGVVVLVVVVPKVAAGVGEWLRPSLEDEGVPLGWLDREWSSWWSAWSWLVVILAAVVLGGWVWRWWLRRRKARRTEEASVLGHALARLMPGEWDPDRQLRVLRWRRLRPERVRIGLTAECPDRNPEWRLAVSAALRARMGALDPIGWPGPDQLRRRIEVSARTAHRGDIPPEVQQARARDELEERVVKALAGLVPRPAPTAKQDAASDAVQVRVRYGETTRDQSLQWRARVVDQVSARLGQSFRATWDRQQRTFTLDPVPELPAQVDWKEQVERFRQLNPGRYVAAYGTDEDGNTVCYEPGNSEPHAMYTGETGSGKALCTLTPIPTPTGWTRMGDLQVGDQVFDEQGRPTVVTGVFDQPPDRECFEVVFSDGSVVVADAEHRWWTEDRAARAAQLKAQPFGHYRRQRTPYLSPTVTVRLRAAATDSDTLATITVPDAARLAGVAPTGTLVYRAARTVSALPERRVTGRDFCCAEQTVTQTQMVSHYPARVLYEQLLELADRCADLAAHRPVLAAQTSQLGGGDQVVIRDVAALCDVTTSRAANWIRRTGVPGHLRRRTLTLTVAAKTVRRRAPESATLYPRVELLEALADRNDQPRNGQRHRLTGGRVCTTVEIRDTLRTVDGRLNHAVPVAAALDLPDVGLPIGPYTLGAWLGASGSAQITSADPEVLDYIRAEGYQISLHRLASDQHKACRSYGVGGLHHQLSATGLLKRDHTRATKRIPSVYLRSSIRQRRALLAGLLDTDGTVAPRGSVEFTTTLPGLAEDVLELAVSLGFRATSRRGTAWLDGDYGPKWTVAFTTDIPVFRLTRKNAALRARTTRHSPARMRTRFIREVRPVLSVPMRCISVDSPSNLYLAGRSMIPTHNTVAMTSVLNSLLLAGCLVAIIDPKRKDFAHYLGRPGIICVATSVEDMVGALVDLRAELQRRTAAAALRELEEQYPHLVDGAAPAQAAIDQVPLIIFFDELSVFVDDTGTWWRGLSKEQKQQDWGSATTSPPALQIPSQIVALARAIKMHMVLGTQRPDARNFGDSSTMRDNIKHMSSMGQQSAIGSEMQWGDRITGRDVVISDDVGGTGISNGLRVSPAGRRLGRGVPGRYKAWYSGDVAKGEEFWVEVAKVAPDASLVRMPHVSDAARDPAAAVRLLRRQAYTHGLITAPIEVAPEVDEDTEAGRDVDAGGEDWTRFLDVYDEAADKPSGVPAGADTTPAPPPESDECPTTSEVDLLRQSGELVVAEGKASAALLQRQLRIGSARAQQLVVELQARGVVGPARGTKPREVLLDAAALGRALGDIPLPPAGVIPPVPPAHLEPEIPTAPEAPVILPVSPAVTDPAPASVEAEIDQDGLRWVPIAAGRVEAGDIISFGDVAAAEVIEPPQTVEDEFDGAELIRLVVAEDGEEQIVDLTEDEPIYRRMA